MAEEPTLAPDKKPVAEPELVEDEDTRSYGTLGTVLLIILVIVIIILFWRTCSERDEEGAGRGGVIETVEGLEAQEDAVSIWVKPGRDVDAILARNGLAGSAYVFMGDGTYIVTQVPDDIEDTVEQLKQDPDLNDAGFVFTDEWEQ
jgi:hypothetical protein